VLVATNDRNQDAAEDFDLTQMHRLGATVRIYRTTADSLVNLAEEAGRVNAAGHLIDRQPPSSISTYVLDGEPIAAERRARNRD
jgi:hypothetical protein